MHHLTAGEGPPVVVVGDHPASVGVVLAAAGVPVVRIAARDVDDQTSGELWLVPASDAHVLAKRFAGRPPGADRIVFVAEHAMTGSTWWAIEQVYAGADVVTTALAAGAEVLRGALADTM